MRFSFFVMMHHHSLSPFSLAFAHTSKFARDTQTVSSLKFNKTAINPLIEFEYNNTFLRIN